ncbi:MAG: ribosome small subunit-dependent GTPase A [Acutalibacteraceae bacterium]
MSDIQKGIILKGIGGLYFVETADAVFECRARGIFRKIGEKPLAGDNVEIHIASDGTENTIEKIYPRSSELMRPPVANIDRLFILSSIREPSPNTLIIDKMTAIACSKNIEPVVVITKDDLGDTSEFRDIYEKAGIPFFSVSSRDGRGVEEIKAMLKGHISAFAGNTGVGKSSLLNLIDPELALKTGEISDKLGRGRHTTRAVELYPLCGGYVADTPGFSSLTGENSEIIPIEELPFCFPEFEEYLGKCRFTTCRHINDKGCEIVKAVEDGKISVSRHNSYAALYNEAKDIKEWEKK